MKENSLLTYFILRSSLFNSCFSSALCITFSICVFISKFSSTWISKSMLVFSVQSSLIASGKSFSKRSLANDITADFFGFTPKASKEPDN